MVKVDDGDTNHQLLTTEIETLNSFRSRSGLALSVYIDLRSTQQKEKAIDTVRSLVRRCLEDTKCDERAWETIQEDIDLIQIYLRTNSNRQAIGLAVFSCAQDLFWRACPVWAPIKAEVYIGSEFNTCQLLEVMERVKAKSVA